MNNGHHCSYCNSAHTNEVEFNDSFKAGRKQLAVAGMKKIVCSECQSESIPLDLLDYNQKLFFAAEAAATKIVSPGSLKELRVMWELSQKDASKIFGAGLSSFGKWESNQSNMSTPAALLIKVAFNFPEVVPYLSQLAKVELKVDSYGYKGMALPVPSGAYEAMQIVNEAANGNVIAFPTKSTTTTKQSAPIQMPVEIDWTDAEKMLEAA